MLSSSAMFPLYHMDVYIQPAVFVPYIVPFNFAIIIIIIVVCPEMTCLIYSCMDGACLYTFTFFFLFIAHQGHSKGPLLKPLLPLDSDKCAVVLPLRLPDNLTQHNTVLTTIYNCSIGVNFILLCMHSSGKHVS